jgi:hypothetical protein
VAPAPRVTQHRTGARHLGDNGGMSHAAAAYTPPLSDTARLLGNLGLVPFVLGALLIWVVNAEAHPYATLALSAYAAVKIGRAHV